MSAVKAPKKPKLFCIGFFASQKFKDGDRLVARLFCLSEKTACRICRTSLYDQRSASGGSATAGSLRDLEDVGEHSRRGDRSSGSRALHDQRIFVVAVGGKGDKRLRSAQTRGRVIRID